MRVLSDWRTVVLRLGVVICVVVAALTAAGRLDDTIAVFDVGADANAQRSYTGRTYPELSWVAGKSAVLEEARLQMPKDATYRVVVGYADSYAEATALQRQARAAGLGATQVAQDGCGRLRVSVDEVASAAAAATLIAATRDSRLDLTVEADPTGP